MGQPDRANNVSFITTAERLADGTAFEQISGGRLLLYRDGRSTIAENHELDGVTYSPIPLDPSIAAALDLPDGAVATVDVPALLHDLKADIESRTGLPSSHCLLLAATYVSTWVAESLPETPVLNFWDPNGVNNSLLLLSRCYCRRPLFLTATGITDLCRQLPSGLCPTLLFEQPSPRELEQLVRTMTRPNVAVLRGGRLLRMPASLLISTLEPVTLPALSIPAIGTRSPTLSVSESERISKQWKPSLLAFRLQQYRNVASSPCPLPLLSSMAAHVASILTATFATYPGLQQEIVEAITPLNEQFKSIQSQEPQAVILEALLALVHEQASLTYVKEVTELANAIYQGRGESRNLETRKVGWLLRNQLGLFPERSSQGYRLDLSSSTTRVRIHQHAHTLGVLSTLEAYPSCSLCQNSTPAEVHDIQDVHPVSAAAVRAEEVHDVQDVHDVQCDGDDAATTRTLPVTEEQQHRLLPEASLSHCGSAQSAGLENQASNSGAELLAEPTHAGITA